MTYKRNRTETLTLRLTAQEKQMLKQKAEERNRTLTDFILLSALEHSDARSLRPILKKLDELHGELKKLQQKENTDEVCDALAKQKELYQAVLNAIKNR